MESGVRIYAYIPKGLDEILESIVQDRNKDILLTPTTKSKLIGELIAESVRRDYDVKTT